MINTTRDVSETKKKIIQKTIDKTNTLTEETF